MTKGQLNFPKNRAQRCPLQDRPHGQILVGVVMLITLVVVLVAATSMFLINMLSLNIVRANQAKAIYAAQSGIYKAIVDYKNNGSITTETDTQISGNMYYSIGGDSANSLRVDSSNPKIKTRELEDMTIYNINSSGSAVLDTITISWSPDGGEKLKEVNFGGGSKEWTGSASSGQQLSVSYTFASGSNYDFKLKWKSGADITSKTVTALFHFADGSSFSKDLIISGAAGDDDIPIKATGKVTAKDTWKKTYIVTYDVSADEITSWKESNNHI